MALKVAIVGGGFMGKTHANVYKALPDAELVALVDHDLKRGEGFGVPAFANFNQMLEQVKPDFVDICLPTYLHKEFVLKAAAVGLHVICEKPIALSVRDADKMIAASGKAGVIFMVAHCIRFWPEYSKLKEITDSGRLGKLVSLNLTRLGAFPMWTAENWIADPAKSGGGVMDMHIHDTDFALYLMGEPARMSSYGTLDHHGASYAFTTFGYPSAVAHLEGGWNLPKGTPFRMTFRAIFEQGAVFWDGGPLTIYQEGREPEVPVFESREAGGGGNISSLGGYFEELKYFVECIRSGRKPSVATPESSRQSLKYVLDEVKEIKAAPERSL